ncbi:nickel/cobalt transporter [Paramagnetospirillum magnetotacticum]|uniref:nickel/cobalt transporter n=1 Tax=Paramagnetospirillum magnetotacticum TaxID=188 RepID=UPI00059709F7|nr:ABC transporter [Paramagnetospirillum magnetotacticum]
MTALWLMLPGSAWAALVPGGGSPTPGTDLPEPLRSIAAWGFALQRQLTGQLREQLAVMKETGSWEPAAAIILAAFLYGVFHAVGPGHGKVVIGGWFATRRARITHGLAASLIAAMVQAGSAIAAVGLLAGLLSLAPRDITAGAAWLELGSFAMIAVIGALMTWRTLTGRGCGHDHGHHHHEGECCGHHDHHDHHHAHEKTERNALFTMAAAVGFRPCSGAILVLLFCFANGMILIGVLATLAMGIGVAVTVAGIGLGALGLNRLVEKGMGNSSLAGRLRTGMALAGSLSITILGLVMLIGALVNGPTPTG